MNTEYTIDNVCRDVNRLNGISISGTTIKIAPDTAIGSKTWGKIDYLVKNGYTIERNAKIVKVNKRTNDEDKVPKRRKKNIEDELIPKIKIHLKKKQ